MRCFVLSVAVLALASVLPSTTEAQSVHVVDKNGGAGFDFLQIQEAVVAASDGDTILVRAGSYDPIDVGSKSLVIQAEAGDFVEVLPTFLDFAAPLLRVEGLFASQNVIVRGIDFRASFLGTAPALVVLENNAGSVWIEDCETVPTGFFVPGLQAGLRATDCAGVTVARCTILGSLLGSGGACAQVPGIAATNSNLSLWDTTAGGSHGSNPGGSGPQKGGHGVVVDGGSLYASGCTFQGGDGGGGFLGQDGADGGDGLVLAANGPAVRVLDTSSQGGEGGNGNGLGTSPGDHGVPLTVLSGTLTPIAGDARSFQTDSPIRAGVGTLTETFTGQPGDLVVLAYSETGPSPGFFVGAAKGNLVLAPPLVILTKGTIDGTGILVTQPPAPPIGLGVDTLPVVLQGAVISSTGEGIFLTGPSFLSLLDPGL